MGRKRTGKSPSFFWQGLLILLPVIVLAAAGIWSLRGQRQAAEEKARQDAQKSAKLELARLGPELRETLRTSHRPVPLNKENDEPFPFLYPLNPQPPSDLEPDKAFQVALEPPTESPIDPQLGALSNPRIADFNSVLERHPNGYSASGVPLEPLVLYQIYEMVVGTWGGRHSVGRKLAAALVESHPSVISEPFLEKLGFKASLAEWREQEKTRAVLRDFLETHSTNPTSQWMTTPEGETWRIEVFEEPQGSEKVYVQAVRHSALRPVFASSVPEDYLDYVFDYDGVRIDPDQETDGAEIFTTAESGGLVANVILTDPQLLYADQRRQTNWFIGIVATAAATALFGLWVARRAHVQQQAVNRMKSNFVSSVSHELRAPIASIRLMAERLRAGRVVEDEKRSEYFGFIEQESRRLATLVENVLDFSRIEDGRKTYKFEETDITQLAEDTTKLMQPYAAEHQVTLTSELKAPDYHLSIDATEIQQALINLIDNAIKYSPEGESVTVGLENGNAERLSLWVQDHGQGIALEEQAKIFQRFYRIGSELERETQGVGIGLAIVRHTVEAHAGEIRLDSRPGKGSRFTLELPLHR